MAARTGRSSFVSTNGIGNRIMTITSLHRNTVALSLVRRLLSVNVAVIASVATVATVLCTFDAVNDRCQFDFK